MTTGCCPTEAVCWQTHGRKPLPRRLISQISLWTSSLWAADKLRLCMAAYCSAPCLPSSSQSLRPCGIYKVNIKSEEGKYPAVFPSPMCAIFGALWFRLNSKWKQCCFFSFTPPPSSRTACQTTFLWIISDMRGPFQPSLAPLCPRGLAFIRPAYWLHMAKVDCVLSSRERCLGNCWVSCHKTCLEGDFLDLLCTRGLASARWQGV